jgi:hypothetical protein
VKNPERRKIPKNFSNRPSRKGSNQRSGRSRIASAGLPARLEFSPPAINDALRQGPGCHRGRYQIYPLFGQFHAGGYQTSFTQIMLDSNGFRPGVPGRLRILFRLSSGLSAHDQPMQPQPTGRRPEPEDGNPTPLSNPGGEPWIVVPAYNEALRLAETLRSLSRLYRRIVVVDDGSTDATQRIAAPFDVWYLRHVFNCGQGAALQTGIDFALRQGAEFVVTFDADGQHCMDDIARLLEPLWAGSADVVLGSRFLGSAEGIPLGRWLILKLGVLFTRIFSRIDVTDTHNGLRAMNRSAAARIRITQSGMAHASEILDQIRHLGLRCSEVPVTVRYTQETLKKGQSSFNGLRIVAKLVMGRIMR